MGSYPTHGAFASAQLIWISDSWCPLLTGFEPEAASRVSTRFTPMIAKTAFDRVLRDSIPFIA
jgi:hypothetical protein